MFLRNCSTNTLRGVCKQLRSYATFEQGDFCMLRQLKTNKKMFVGPLEEAGERGLRGGKITHADIIGKKPRSVINTQDGKCFGN